MDMDLQVSTLPKKRSRDSSTHKVLARLYFGNLEIELQKSDPRAGGTKQLKDFIPLISHNFNLLSEKQQVSWDEEGKPFEATTLNLRKFVVKKIANLDSPLADYGPSFNLLFEESVQALGIQPEWSYRAYYGHVRQYDSSDGAERRGGMGLAQRAAIYTLQSGIVDGSERIWNPEGVAIGIEEGDIFKIYNLSAPRSRHLPFCAIFRDPGSWDELNSKAHKGTRRDLMKICSYT